MDLISRKAAEMNSRPCPEHLLKAADLPQSGGDVGHKEPLGAQRPASVLDLARPAKMALRTANMCFQVTLRVGAYPVLYVCAVVQCDYVLLWTLLRIHRSRQ